MDRRGTEMRAIDLEHLREWVGRERSDADTASLRHARLMSATVGRPGPALAEGDALPPLWHWIYFLDGVPGAELGPDGHPARGAFLPPVPLPNRMWAGGRVRFEAPIAIGSAIERRSRVQSVERKRGRSGELVFVTVAHEVFSAGRRALQEEHDIVYREATAPGAPREEAPAPAAPRGEAPASAAGRFRRDLAPDSTMLFRYSALTFNGHRIHYDLDYCRNVEGYENLVVHGPLCATWLAAFAEEVSGRRLAAFEYRALRPVLLGMPLALHANAEAARVDAWTAVAGGQVAMRSSAELG